MKRRWMHYIIFISYYLIYLHTNSPSTFSTLSYPFHQNVFPERDEYLYPFPYSHIVPLRNSENKTPLSQKVFFIRSKTSR